MTKQNLIYAALAYLDNYESSPSMTEAINTESGYEIYLKNALVCLVSARQHNSGDDVALITNIRLNEHWCKQFEANNIDIVFCAYDTYLMPAATNYSLSYYKLCATEFIVQNTDYDRYCFMDCDEYVVGGFENLWCEADDAFMIKPNDSARTARVRSEINRIHDFLYPESCCSSIVHFSSGNFCATKNRLRAVMSLCHKVYDDLKDHPEIDPFGGDEVIFSLALSMYEEKIYTIKPYVLLSNIGFRSYWVDVADFQSPDIAIWHLPAEKRYSLRWAYSYYIRKGRIPESHLMARASRIRPVFNRFTLLSLIAIFGDKTSLKRNISKLKKRIGVGLG